MPKNLRRAILSCAGCTLMLLVTCGLACNVFSAAQPYILAGNGFTNTQTSLITTIRSAAYLLGTFVIGCYYRRIGYRVGCALAAVLVSVSFLLFAVAKSLAAYYAAGAAAGVGYAFGSMVPASILMRPPSKPFHFSVIFTSSRHCSSVSKSKSSFSSMKR